MASKCSLFTYVSPNFNSFDANSEEDCITGLRLGNVNPGDIVVVRYEGPKGGPSMREMLSQTATLAGMGLDKYCALITDGRFSGVSKGSSIGHISPEAAAGGLIAYILDGDIIEIDIPHHKLELNVSEDEIEKRKKRFLKESLFFNLLGLCRKSLYQPALFHEYTA